MKKVIRDGKVAVLYSPGFGAGWHSWGAPEAAIFHPELVRLVEEGRAQEIDDELIQNIFGDSFYTGGAYALCIKWLDEGTAFQIDEYDGNESISIRDMENWIIA